MAQRASKEGRIHVAAKGQLSELWSGEELGKQHGSYVITIPDHGARILVGKSSGSEQP